MSVRVSSWVWQDCTALAGSELVLMLALADVADDRGRCLFHKEESDLTYAALARKTRVDRRTIVRLVAKLRDRGLLRHVPGQNGRSNEFTMVVPWEARTGDNLSPVTRGEPVTSVHEPVTSDARTGDIWCTPTSLIRIDVKDVDLSSEVADATTRPELIRILDLLDSEIERNGSKKPSRTKRNLDAARLLIDKDGRTVEQVENAIRWCQASTFWRANILSMASLRDNYDKLRLHAMREREDPRQRKLTNAERAALDWQEKYGSQGSAPAIGASVSS